MPACKSKCGGASLLEIVISVAITAALAMIGVPKYKSFLAVGKQGEAKTNLSHIFSLEMIYLGQNNRYGAMGVIGPGGKCVPTPGPDWLPGENDINFTLSPCSTTTYSEKVRYYYEVVDLNTNVAFLAYARTGFGAENFITGCDTVKDSWQINEAKFLRANVTASGAGDSVTDPTCQ